MLLKTLIQLFDVFPVVKNDNSIRTTEKVPTLHSKT